MVEWRAATEPPQATAETAEAIPQPTRWSRKLEIQLCRLFVCLFVFWGFLVVLLLLLVPKKTRCTFCRFCSYIKHHFHHETLGYGSYRYVFWKEFLLDPPCFLVEKGFMQGTRWSCFLVQSSQYFYHGCPLLLGWNMVNGEPIQGHQLRITNFSSTASLEELLQHQHQHLWHWMEKA